jgi:hypothetical protein
MAKGKREVRLRFLVGEQLKSRWVFRTLEGFALGQGRSQPRFSAEAPMSDIVLTPEQEAEARRLAELVSKKIQEEALQMCRLMASKPNHQLLGAVEFEMRDRAHKIAADVIQTAVNERKKGGTKGRA